MFRKASCVALALMFVSVWGCATNRESLAEKDRIINEKSQENLALRRQLEDAETTRKLLGRQFDKQKGEVTRLTSEQADTLAECDRLRQQLDRPATGQTRVPGLDVNIVDPNVEVITRSNGEIVLRVNNEVTFTSGSATLTKRGQKVLQKVASVLAQHGTYSVSVEGHTDDTPLKATKKRWQSNMNLSLARALSVRNFLTKARKIGTKRIRVVGYGETRPIIAQKTKKARAKNRRVEIVLYKSDD